MFHLFCRVVKAKSKKLSLYVPFPATGSPAIDRCLATGPEPPGLDAFETWSKLAALASGPRYSGRINTQEKQQGLETPVETADSVPRKRQTRMVSLFCGWFCSRVFISSSPLLWTDAKTSLLKLTSSPSSGNNIASIACTVSGESSPFWNRESSPTSAW